MPRFVSQGEIIYLGDTGDKLLYINKEKFHKLGLDLDRHGKTPDIIIFDKDKNWLFLIEAVTSHGPINPKRKIELQKVFNKSKADIVYVTAFLDRKNMVKYLPDISWETEVWVAESPSHMIHFDGKKFLGPYNKQ